MAPLASSTLASSYASDNFGDSISLHTSAIVGAVITVLSYKINEILLLFRLLEEWFFWLCKTERPIPKDGIRGVTIPDKKPGGWLA